ncbi:endonuclease/exonuclease/phosphatase family protein [Paenibacillus sp. J2TS4]|uniref:endonuclease/exonuclease/phosphatase family protein n=1 Tax=Paenibacillus sp. J2TS4 TaxID=2807194 RepID=UPI001B04307E|nr:endonuclease/exonuclease/phosphatase family protein [Paenibacillus sp. J2TS4]GIP31567.1 metal-dependent hydrolase [Paenibacillus sp. J2TS4]
MEIKVLTFNIHHGRGTDGKVNLERIAQVIEACNADVIALNEVDKHFAGRSGYIDQVSWLSERLGMNRVFGSGITRKPSRRTNFIPRQYGNAVLSRFPITEHRNYVFAVSPINLEDRALLEVGLLIEGQPLNLYVTHLSLTPYIQMKQVSFIFNQLANVEQPLILLGDFNTRPQSKVWRSLTARLTDVCHTACTTPCLTFPSFRPKVQLDYIFISDHLHVTSAEVVHLMPVASDHLPVQATIKFK